LLLEILPLRSTLLDEVRLGYSLLEISGKREPILVRPFREADTFESRPGVLYPGSQALFGPRRGVGGDYV
jgi:hypothetical protein